MPEHGKLLGDGPNFTYKPDGNYFGDDFFTFYGLMNGRKTKDAIISINVVNINDPPTLKLSEGFVGNVEGHETTIKYRDLLKYINMADVENADLTLLINQVISGTVYSDKPVPDNGKFVIKEGEPLQWRPENDDFGHFLVWQLGVLQM